MKVFYTLLDDVHYEELTRYIALLPVQRREKIERYRYESDRLLSLVAGLMVRAYVTRDELCLNEHGKPFLLDHSRYFSLSHSGRCVMIAIDDHEIGADVEELPDLKTLKVADRFFHPAEQEYVAASDDSQRAFARIWTRKEAYLKQIGTGIADDLQSFDSTSDELSRRIVTVDLDGYAMSVCSAEAIKTPADYISKLELKQLLSDNEAV